MDPITTPFPAGTPPSELSGQDAVLEQARILLGRVKAGRSEKSFFIIGLRGVGKTALLNEIEHMAKKSGYLTVAIEAQEGKGLGQSLASLLRGVLSGFVSGIKTTTGKIDIEPVKGATDSGDLGIDLPALLVAVGEAALERGKAVVILADDVQHLSKTELSALIMSMHRIQQLQLPVVLIGTGLPTLPGLAGDSKPYVERLFSFPEIG